MVTGASEAFIQRHHATSRACGKTCDMRHPLLRNLDVGQEPRGKQTSVSLPAGAFLHYEFALVFHPLCQAFCAMELGAQFVCFIIFSSRLVCWHASTLACIYCCLAGTLSHQNSAVNIFELYFRCGFRFCFLRC